MDYEKLYKDTITKLQEMVNSGKITAEIACGICADFVPESEDERIKNVFRELGENYLFWGKLGLTKEKAIAWLEKQGEQKPQRMVSAEAKEAMYNKSAWSEEDEKQARQIERIVHDDGCTQKLQKQIADWFKSLKDRYTWKPSEGPLECLDYAIEKAEKDWSPLTNNRIYLTLKALKEQLLELRGSKV